MEKYKVHFDYEDGKYKMRVVVPDNYGRLQVLESSCSGGALIKEDGSYTVTWDHHVIYEALKRSLAFTAFINSVDCRSLSFEEHLGE